MRESEKVEERKINNGMRRWRVKEREREREREREKKRERERGKVRENLINVFSIINTSSWVTYCNVLAPCQRDLA